MDPCDDGEAFSAKMLYEYPLAPPLRSSLARLPGWSTKVFEEAFEENIEFRFGRPGKFPPFSMITDSRMPAGVEIRFGGDKSDGSLDQPRERKAMFDTDVRVFTSSN